MPPASGSAEVAHGSAQNGFTAVLFDWRGTLFHDESDQDWIRASAASIGRTPSDDEVDHLLEGARRTAGRMGVDEVIAAAEGLTVSYER